MGLSIVKYIVERHRGQIGVESKENNGTKFWLTLPKGTSQSQLI
ncbi:MAG: ATP-binding protein [Planctomycetota bacterium]